jgi:hypothetical protein
VTRSTVRLFLALAAFLVLIVPTTAQAQVTPAAGYTPPDDSQSVKVGATIFWDYTYTKTPKVTDAANNSISPSSFNVGRTYINVTGNLSHNVQFRITPDITRVSGTGTSLNGSYGFRLKYGYAQFNVDSSNWKQTWIRAGQQQTTFVDTEEGIYRYRFQGSIFADRDAGVSSSDIGVSFHTTLPSNYGDIHVGLYNGEGYAKPEANDQKSLQGRITLRPFAKGSLVARGLRVGIYANRDKTVKGADRNKWIAHAFFEHTRFNAGFDYLRGEDQTLPTSSVAKSDGYTAWVTPFFQKKGDGLEGLVRYDSYRTNRTIDARRNRTIAGLAYWFPHPGGNGTAAILLDYEQVSFANYTTAQAKQQRVTLHGLINF